MELRYRALTSPQSVLVATTISSGSQPRCFKSGMGLEYGVDHHRFESHSHALSEEDEQRLVDALTKRASSEPNFWGDYIGRSRSLESRLISTVRSALSRPGPSGNHRDLLDGFLAVTGAMQEMAPFVVATPAALAVLTSHLDADVAELAPRLLTPWSEPDPVSDMRNGYRIALEILKDEAAAELFRTTSPMIALGRVKEEFPELHRAIHDHVDEYGWLRTRGYRYDPLSPETLVYRIQLAVLRWPAEAIEEAAQPQPVPTAEQVLGLSLSESGARSVAAIQALLTRRAFRVDGHLQAECLARPFWGRIAEALGCTPRQILWASVDEIGAALTEQGELPIGELDLRASNGFTVHRDHDSVAVRSDATPSTDGVGPGAATGVLTGMTACRGTAVGRVRIVLDQEELFSLEVGDVLVTAASTIDPTDTTGQTTVFPTRNGGPHARALERAAAVVADEGGLLSHAAIVCRERGLTCVLGAETATTTLVDGQVVEVDATKPMGIVIPLGEPHDYVASVRPRHR
jgi:phosphohistidine swiveling domain-containing protein